MADRDQFLQAIEAQEQLRGSVSDEIIDAAILALRAQIEATEPDRKPVEKRRQATVLFADVAGFTAMSAALDAEVVAGVMNELWAVVDDIIGRRGGTVDKHVGDAVMGVWGAEFSRENDPERAIRAALELRESFSEFRAARDLDVGLRIGVNTGPVVFGAVGTAGEQSVTGDAVNVASRLEHVGPAGGVLISHDTYRHVRGVFDVRPQELVTVKGKSEPIRTYVVENAKQRSFREASPGVEGIETRMIGRESAFAALRDAFLSATEERSARFVTVVGEAGAGKSRLLYEFTNWLDLRPEAIYYLKSRSVPDLTSVPRAVVRDLYAFRLEISEGDSRAEVASKLRAGLEPLSEREADVAAHWLGFDLSASQAVQDLSGSPEYGNVARSHVLRHLRSRVERSPAVILFEDVHWADIESLEFIEQLSHQLTDVPVLVVCFARPLLFERRSEWASADWSTHLKLEPLTDSDIRVLVHEILQRADHIPRELSNLVVEQASGNPFHAEELIKMLIDDGTITTSANGPWRIELDPVRSLSVPATLTGVMQARLDGLTGEELQALQHASVIGRVFWDEAVAALASDRTAQQLDGPGLGTALDSACSRELALRHEHSTFATCQEFRFKHALLRDATYETVLLKNRQSLHLAAAAWLERRAGDRINEHLGQIAEHLARAGSLDRAAQMLERVGDNARATGALQPARSAFERALGLRAQAGTTGGRDGVRSSIELGSVLIDMRDEMETATRLLEGAEVHARRLGEDELRARAMCGLIWAATRRGAWPEAQRLVGMLRPLAEVRGGDVLAEAMLAEAVMHAEGGDVQTAIQVSAHALAASRQLSDRSRELKALNVAAGSLARVGRLDEADALFENGIELARAIGNREREALIASNQASMAHPRLSERDPDQYAVVIDRYRRSVQIHADLGLKGGRNFVFGNLAQAEVEGGDIESGALHAREFLRDGWENGVSQDWSLALVVEAQVRLGRGDVDGGLELMGAVASDPRSPAWNHEFERIFSLYDIDPQVAEEVMSRGRGTDLGPVVDRLLAAKPPHA